ncbi:MAG TPA: S8 family serine peptidase, partial [Dehalococcoidia bacterium]|nr:S8 family serine peptidase [Dehalococcoidia bacterium]
AYLSVESVTPLNVGPLDGGDDERISLNDGYDPGDGTSFSAPFVAGTAALMLSRNPTLSGIEVMDIIKAAAQDLPDAGEPNWDGAGRLRANVALAAVPATFLGRVTSQGAPAGPGIRIDAYVGEQLCGSTVSTFGNDGSSEYQLDVASAMLQPGCGTEGATVRITVAGANTAVEAPWNGTVTSIDLETALGTSGTGIELEAGWNLVAFSFTPTTTSIESLLAPLGDAAVSAITFDEAEQVFRFFVPGNPGVSDFTELPPLAGMWLRVSGPVTLVVPDSGVPPPETVELVAGLNLVGLPLNGPVPIAETVASIQGALLSILGFTDGLDGAFLVYLPDGSLATLTELRPNEGYWFVASEATTLRP